MVHEYHYFFYSEQCEEANAAYELFSLLKLLNVAIKDVYIARHHVGDITVSVSYSLPRSQAARPTS